MGGLLGGAFLGGAPVGVLGGEGPYFLGGVYFLGGGSLFFWRELLPFLDLRGWWSLFFKGGVLSFSWGGNFWALGQDLFLKQGVPIIFGFYWGGISMEDSKRGGVLFWRGSLTASPPPRDKAEVPLTPRSQW